ncbi:hypothetical protein ACHWQZ_G013567 [Mnemiopsis leidyi]
MVMKNIVPTLLKRFSKRKRKHVLNKTHYGVMYAVMNEDEACLLSAIKAGAPLNSHIDLEDTSVAGDLDSKTPLHWVASRGNANFLKLLLEAGADPNAKGTWSGRTPLLECSDNIECTRLLLAAGADVNAVDSEGNSVLHYAARTEQFSYLQYRFLVQCGAKANVTNRLGETPIHKLCSYSNDTLQRSKALNICIKNGCNVNKIDYNGRTALHLAAAHSNEECVQTLLRNDAVVDAADYDGMTPLHFASRRRGGEGCVAILLNAGAEPDYESGNAGYTALQLAVQHNNVASVRLLLHYGARPVCQSPNYDICRRSCCVRHHTSCTSRGSFRQVNTEDTPLLLTASQLIVANAIGTVPSLQSLCRLVIRRLTGPRNLHKLLELQQPPSSGYLAHRGEKPTNTDDSIPHIKRKTSCLAQRALLENENLDQETKYLSLGCGEGVLDSADLIPGPIRRYLLHVEEYEMWWEMRKKNKIFAIAAAGSARYR